MTTLHDLTNKQCKPCVSGMPPLTENESRMFLQQLDQWTLIDNHISKTFSFKNYYQVLAFVNAVAWITHHEDHHPDMTISFNQCRVEYSTHAVGGLSENDFICAAKVDELLKF